jgi:hypothetical protein
MTTQRWAGPVVAAAVGGVASFTAVKVGQGTLLAACLSGVLSALVVFFIAMFFTRRQQQ